MSLNRVSMVENREDFKKIQLFERMREFPASLPEELRETAFGGWGRPEAVRTVAGRHRAGHIGAPAGFFGIGLP